MKEDYFFEVSVIRTVHVAVRNAESLRQAKKEIKKRMDNAIFDECLKIRDNEIWDESTINMKHSDINDEFIEITDYDGDERAPFWYAFEQEIDMDKNNDK